MRVVSWNMNRCQRTAETHAEAWEYLRDELRADIVLAQEAQPAESEGVVYRAIDAEHPRYNWGSAVICLSPKYELRARSRRPIHLPYDEREIPESHPGTLAIADVCAKGTTKPTFCAVSFYAKWDYLKPGDKESIYATSTAHRLLSDLSPMLMWSWRTNHPVPVLLTGDLNQTTQIAYDGTWAVEIEEARTFFDRIKALGLVDLFNRNNGRHPQRVTNCSCPNPCTCNHVRTYRHANRKDSRPTQLDYAFTSKALVPYVDDCRVEDTDPAWGLSDHCPIVVDLDERIASDRLAQLAE